MDAPQNEIDALADEESSLLKQLEDIRRRKQEAIKLNNERILAERKEREAKEPFVLTVYRVAQWGFEGPIVVETESDYYEPAVEVMRHIPSRRYGGGKVNTFNLEDWPLLLERLKVLTKVVDIKYLNDTQSAIEKYLNQKNWAIHIDSKYIYAMAGWRANQRILRDIPGVEFQSKEQRWRIPLAEAHKLWEILSKEENVQWTDEANNFVIDQLKQRALADQIATMEVDEEYAAFTLKDGIKLRPFQTVGCRFLEVAGNKGLLAHEMGLGKTIMAIAHGEKQGFKKKLVICPATLKPNWFREILKFAGKKAKVLYGSEPGTADMLDVMPVDTPYEWFIINYDILGRKKHVKREWVDTEGFKHVEEKDRFLWAELIDKSSFDAIYVDEAHYVKSMDSNRSQALRNISNEHFVFMTGTPVLNRPGELFPILTKLAHDTFPSYDLFLRQYTYDGKSARNVKELQELLKPLMLRKLKKDVFKDLPAVDRRQQWFELSDKAKELYDKVLTGIYELIADYHPGAGAGAEKSVPNILAQIMRLKQICAIDKSPRTADLAVELYDQTDESEHRKVIIFTQFKAVAWKIGQLLGNEALSFVRRSGSEFITANTIERDNLVQQFQNDPSIHFLVATEKTMKEGHNATAAGHVIFNDLFWTPAGHDQAIGRAYGRISDMHGVDAYFSMADRGVDEAGNELECIEDWQWELLAFKQGVIDETVEGVEGTRDASVALMLIEKIREHMIRGRK